MAVPRFSNPFVVAEVLPSPQAFIGRSQELTTFAQEIAKGHMVAIVGDRKIGKSWFLQHIVQRVQQQQQPSQRYIPCYVPLAASHKRHLEELYGAIAHQIKLQAHAEVEHPDPSSTCSFHNLQTLLANINQAGKKPILCLDDVDQALQHLNYPDVFLRSLEALTLQKTAILVLSARQAIAAPSNDGEHVALHTIPLAQFSQTETERLIRQVPQNAEHQPILQEHYQNLALRWGQCHPYRLQLAAHYLYEAQIYQRHPSWAKVNFLRSLQWQRQVEWQPWLKTLSLLPQELGAAMTAHSTQLSNQQKTQIGWATIALLSTVVLGFVVYQQIPRKPVPTPAPALNRPVG
ncbi:ATP-binding protein [Leptolyngbya sp. AN02str]|uniref:ATP-binding protein n=1 Tax=Leptolyngbya sp. AN02str TaxID=3423363 RepID=UPI003D31FDCB